MFDESEMVPELEKFAAELRQVEAPEANIDRDQLMYDAGWAAAKAQNKTSTVIRSNGWRTVALSFASGVSVAAAVLLLALPLADESSTDTPTTGQVAVATPAETTVERSNEPNVMDWIENIPHGHSLASGFASRPVLQAIPRSGKVETRSQYRNRRQPTTQTLMQELMPRTQSHKMTTDWSAWLINGI